MKLFFYYVLHTAKNSIKKLFKSWVLAFVAICLVGGMFIGLLVGGIASHLEKQAGENEPGQEQTDPSWSEDETDPEEEGKFDPKSPEGHAQVLTIAELIAGGVILLIFVLMTLSADKSGGQIFLPADVNLLFPSPMKPQTALLFRVLTRIGPSMAGSLYLLFQIPNLLNAGISLGGCFALFFGLALTTFTGSVLQTFFYVTASNHPGFKRSFRYVIYAVLLLAAGGYILYTRSAGLGWWDSARAYFNAPLTRLIPFWGWIKAFMMYALEGQPLMMLIYLLVTAAGCGVLALLVWRMKADFYEDALLKTEEKAEMMAAAQRSAETGVSLMKRKKDRSEKLTRDGLNKGWGANVYFYKAMYNRFRFAHLNVFTKTMETYIVMALGTAAVCRFAIQTQTPYPVIIVLAVMVFFRSFGNSLQEDTKMGYFVLIPETTFTKLLWILAGDSANCLLDVLPALFIGLIFQGAAVFPAVLWLFLIVTLNAYSSSVATFIGMSSPVGAGKTIRQMAQLLFIYFGLLPDILIVGLALMAGLPVIAVILGTLINFGLAALFMYLSSRIVGR